MTIKNLVQGLQTDALIRLVARMLMAYIFHGTGTPDDMLQLIKYIIITGVLLLMLQSAGKFSKYYRVENNH